MTMERDGVCGGAEVGDEREASSVYAERAVEGKIPILSSGSNLDSPLLPAGGRFARVSTCALTHTFQPSYQFSFITQWSRSHSDLYSFIAVSSQSFLAQGTEQSLLRRTKQQGEERRFHRPPLMPPLLHAYNDKLSHKFPRLSEDPSFAFSNHNF